MTRRILSLAVALLLALSACAAIAEDIYPMQDRPTLTLWTTADVDISLFGYSSYNDTPGFKAWQEATGINVKVTEAVDESALLLLLASGDLPDMIRANKGFYSKGFSGMLEDGIAVKLDDLLPEYAPNYWAFLNSDEASLKSALVDIDGKLSHIAFAGNFYPSDSPFRNYAGMIVRKDFMDKLDIESITTLDEFTEYLSRCKSELGVQTPLMSANNMNEYIWNYGYFTSAFGLPCASNYQVNGEFHFGAYEPQFKDYLEYMHQLYVDGLFDPNFAVTDNATAVAAMSNGTSAAISAMVSRFQVITNAATEEGFQLTAIPSLTANEGEKAYMSYATAITGTTFWCFITKKCKDVEAALRFFDYLYSPKGMDLANYGIEGVTYNYDENGNVVLTDFMAHNPDGFAIDPIARSYGLVNWSCIHRRAFSENRFPMQEQRDACVIWADSQYNDYMISYSSIPSDMQAEYTRIWTELQTYLKEHIANFISGTESLDNFDAYIDGLRQLGMDRYIEIMQAAIDPYFD